MRLRWTAAAADDLEHITNYLFEKTPGNAERLVRRIYRAPSVLKTLPNSGRPGKKQGTRELALTSLPYIVVYQVKKGIVYVVRILPAAQQWPER